MLTVKTLHIYYVYAANINSIAQYFSMNKFLIILNLSLISISSLSANGSLEITTIEIQKTYNILFYIFNGVKLILFIKFLIDLLYIFVQF